MGLVTMKGSLHGAGKRKEKKGVIRRGTGTETGIGSGIAIGIGIEREARIGIQREVGIGKRTVIRIAIVIIEIATETVVGNAVREGEIEMMMIITEAEIMIGKKETSFISQLFRIQLCFLISSFYMDTLVLLLS